MTVGDVIEAVVKARPASAKGLFVENVTLAATMSPGLRVDASYRAGNEVSTHYDAMLGKVIAWAPTREQAIRRLADALTRARLHGVRTNRDELVRMLHDPRFVAGRVSTDLLEERPGQASSGEPDGTAPEAVAAALALAERTVAARRVQHGVPTAWRNVVSQPQLTRFREFDVRWWGGRGGYVVDGFTVVAASADRVTLEADGVRTAYAVAVTGETVDVDSARGHLSLTRVPRFTDPADAVASGSLLAPMPGTVVTVAVGEGDRVETGQPVLVLEAMKMQHTVAAPAGGIVTQMSVQPGAQVAAGEVLAVVEEQP